MSRDSLADALFGGIDAAIKKHGAGFVFGLALGSFLMGGLLANTYIWWPRPVPLQQPRACSSCLTVLEEGQEVFVSSHLYACGKECRAAVDDHATTSFQLVPTDELVPRFESQTQDP